MTKWDPDWVMKPGETLVECLHEVGMRPSQLAAEMGVPTADVDAVLCGGTLTDDFARRLAKVLPISKQMWLNLERAYREGLAAGKKELE